MALDKLNTDLTELVDLIEGGGLDQFDVAEKTALWQRFEAFRNRLPLIDHRMIADAEPPIWPARTVSPTWAGF